MELDRHGRTQHMLLVAALGALALAACGTTDEASRMTLPPLETTTTTTTTTTTIPTERFYTIEPGDSLIAIAAERGVSVVDILNANPDLESEDSIRAGDTIEIPAIDVAVPDTEPESVPVDTEP